MCVYARVCCRRVFTVVAVGTVKRLRHNAYRRQDRPLEVIQSSRADALRSFDPDSVHSNLHVFALCRRLQLPRDCARTLVAAGVQGLKSLMVGATLSCEHVSP